MDQVNTQYFDNLVLNNKNFRFGNQLENETDPKIIEQINLITNKKQMYDTHKYNKNKLDEFIKTETNNKTKKSFSRLTHDQKIEKINEYIDSVIFKQRKYPQDEKKKIKIYIGNEIDAGDFDYKLVEYDKINGKITDIDGINDKIAKILKI